MKKVFILILLLFCYNKIFSQPLCDFMWVDTLTVIVRGDTIDIFDIKACGNCASKFNITVRKSADSLFIIQTDTSGMVATCDCLFDLKTSIIGLNPGTYYAIVHRDWSSQKGLPFDTVLYIGTVKFQINQSSLYKLSENIIFEFYQSECLSNIEEHNLIDLTPNLLLSQNYPNPFNPYTTIEYEVPFNGLVIIKLYDISGREKLILLNEFKNIGKHKIEFNPIGLSTGVYFCKIQLGKLSKTIKISIIK